MKKLWTLGTLGLCCTTARADVKVSPLFADNMILQRGMPVPVWGSADVGETVTVTLGTRTSTAQTGADGKWQVKLDPLEAAPSTSLSIAGKNTLSFKNVAVGEVWLASGQSNMAFNLASASTGGQAVLGSLDPGLRLFKVGKNSSLQPQNQVAGTWQSARPGVVNGFSAVAYFFGRELRRKLGVPVGVIESAVPGTSAQTWMSRASLANNPELKSDILDPFDARTPTAFNGSHPLHHFNGMIAPLLPFGIAGAIWYQGESNTNKPGQYKILLPTLIKDWRAQWGEGDFPFGIVQLPNLGEQQTLPVERGWADLREAQRTSLVVPHTGIAVTLDTGQSYELHPTGKEEVGRRLSLWALAEVYGQNVEDSGPIYQSMQTEATPAGDRIRLHFTHLGGGLRIVDNSDRFGDEKIPVRPQTVGNLELLQRAGLLENLPDPAGTIATQFAAKRALTRRQTARLLAAVEAKLAAAQDTDLKTTPLLDNLKRGQVHAALTYLQGALGPQLGEITSPWKGELRGFALRGADGKWLWANAVLDGDTVLVSSPLLSHPTAVRYDWANNPNGNLFNAAGLPAAPFATDLQP